MALFGLKNPGPVIGIVRRRAGRLCGLLPVTDSPCSASVASSTGQDEIRAKQDTLTRFEIETDSARKQLATASMEDLRRRLEEYRASLELMRRLVPERNEVPNLLDDIASRARIRGVNVAEFTPLTPEAGPDPFETRKYQFSVLGHYDQIGEFLADIASLQRIIVPVDLTLRKAADQAGQGAGRQHRRDARSPVPDPDLREDRRPGGGVQWHLSSPSRPCWPAWPWAAAERRQPEPGDVDMAALRAKRDSIARAKAERDSIARVRYTACTDSVTTEVKKTAAGRRSLPEQGRQRPDRAAAARRRSRGPGHGVGPTPASPPSTADGRPGPDRGAEPSRRPRPPPPKPQGLTPQQQQVARADSIRKAREQARTRFAAPGGRAGPRGFDGPGAGRFGARGFAPRARETEVVRETLRLPGRQPGSVLLPAQRGRARARSSST